MGSRCGFLRVKGRGFRVEFEAQQCTNPVLVQCQYTVNSLHREAQRCSNTVHYFSKYRWTGYLEIVRAMNKLPALYCFVPFSLSLLFPLPFLPIWLHRSCRCRTHHEQDGIYLEGVVLWNSRALSRTSRPSLQSTGSTAPVWIWCGNTFQEK